MRRAAIALALLATGCGPSLHDLIPPKHYREAICYARDGSDRDRAEVEKALTADADVTLHVHTLTPDELRSTLGDATDPFLARNAIARVRIQTNALPVDRLDLVAAVTSDGTRAEPVTWDSLARATREHLPPHRQERQYALTFGNAVAVMTFGLSLLFGVGGDTRAVDVDAPRSEYVRLAPRATALHDVLSAGGCSAVPSAETETGKTCEGYFIVDTSVNAEVRLSVILRVLSLREDGKIDDSPTDAEKRHCELTAQRAVTLGQARSLARATSATFEKGPRRLAELAR